MDEQPSLIDQHAGLVLTNYVSLALPSKEYSTVMLNFPGNNCIPAWDVKGNFCASIETFCSGKLIGTMHLPMIDESGFFEAGLDDLLTFTEEDVSGLIIMRYWQSPKVPIELYFSHIHRATGTYILYPSALYMGDLIYLNTHVEQLENSLFWPGSPIQRNTKLWFAVLNPYRISFSFQVSLFLQDARRIQSDVMKVQPMSMRWIDPEELFKEHVDGLENANSNCSLCITSQHKAVAYAVEKDRECGLITTIDHLRQFTMI